MLSSRNARNTNVGSSEDHSPPALGLQTMQMDVANIFWHGEQTCWFDRPSAVLRS